MFKTEHRPVPLPNQGAEGSPVRGKPRVPSRDENGEMIPPNGATMMAWRYIDKEGRTFKAKSPVPVNDAGLLTHREWHCPACPGSEQWFSASIKVTPSCPTHRKDLKLVKQRRRNTATASTTGFAWGDLLGSQKERLHIAAATAGVGVAGLVADTADLPGWGETAQFAAIPACVAGSWWLTRAWLTRREQLDPDDEVAGRRARNRIGRRARAAAYVTAASGVWLELADAINVTDGGRDGALALATLLGIGIVGSRSYRAWVDDRRRRPAPAPKPADDGELADDTPQPTDEELLRQYVLERWLKVSARGRVLHGTRLEAIHPSVGGWSATIVADDDSDLDPEKFDMPEPVRKIARAYSVGTSMVSIIADPLDANRAMILVQRTSPLSAGRNWDGAGINLDDGTAETMTLEDGTRGRHQFWRAGWGAVMELIAGCTGSGKSEYVNLLLALERKSGRVVSWVGDPQMGQSLGDVRDGVDWFAPTNEEILVMLRCAVAVMLARNLLTTRMRVKETRPNGQVVERRVKYVEVTPDFPLLSITIDEAHLPMNDPAIGKEIVKLLALLSKSGRKANVKVRLLVQSPLLSELKDSVLRAQLASGIVTVFRTADRLTGPAAWPGGKMPGDPSSLPAKWEDDTTAAGVGYSSNTARMRMRSDYAGDLWDVMTEGDTLSLEAAVLGTAGPLYADRWKRLDAFDSMDPAEILGAGIPSNLLDSAPGETTPPAGGREAVLRYFADRWLDGDRDPVPFGELANAVRTTIKTRACTNACNKLVTEQILATAEGSYWLTEAGAEMVGVLEEVTV
ncbi:type IV secretory system conjugative DNA transfer family protein [Paractinoplanes maris]|uniref:type IV secretory system conjugative DNA transfer family protein n=1 Tax=Paractinoplanes maris TaxID=1734446 RepID=UPI002021C43E|nr:type IV secretory system conjugative DNA transfer family protein [Actinoplanes maris]